MTMEKLETLLATIYWIIHAEIAVVRVQLQPELRLAWSRQAEANGLKFAYEAIRTATRRKKREQDLGSGAL